MQSDFKKQFQMTSLEVDSGLRTQDLAPNIAKEGGTNLKL